VHIVLDQTLYGNGIYGNWLRKAYYRFRAKMDVYVGAKKMHTHTGVGEMQKEN